MASLSTDLAQGQVQESEIAVVGVSHTNPKSCGVVVVASERAPLPPGGEPPESTDRCAPGATTRLSGRAPQVW